jgi:capsular exopolysaccharide synthesis family protein
MNDLSMGRDVGNAARIAAVQSFRPDLGAKEGDGDRIPLLTRYLRIVLRWRWVILGIIAATLIIGLVITLLMTPYYRATVRIEIAREANKVVNIQGVSPESSPIDLEFFQTQYGLLKSRSLAEKVARQLNLVDNRKFFEMFGEERAYEQANSSQDSRSTRPTRLRKAGEILLEHLEIAPIRGSSLVDVNFTSPDPALSQQVANAWAENFIRINLQRRFDASSYARRFLEERLEQLRAKLEESERNLVAYAGRQRIINLPAQGGATGTGSAERSLVADDLASLNIELAKATADRVRAQSQLSRTQNGGATDQGLENLAISGIRQKRAELAGEYSRLLSQFKPDYPPAVSIASQIRELDRSIAREEARVGQTLRTNYEASVARENDLRNRVAQLEGKLLDLKRRSIQYNIYQRDVDTNRQLYDGLLQRYKEIGVAAGIGTNNIAIVDRAEIPERPASPRLVLNMAVALLAGLALACAAAFALEHIDETITNPGDVADELELPLLGTIPRLAAGEDPMQTLQDRKSALVDAYLAVQTYLELSTEQGVPATLSVASTRPAEGKSTTAYAVALLLARARKRVLLIDGDMRSPSVHRIFGLRNAAGLSNYLAGADDYRSNIHATANEGLFAMSAGPTPPNAAELLGSGRLQTLLDVLTKEFDHVVIDSPPVMGLADALLIASRVEGTVFAVESHGIRAGLVRVAIERLRGAHARLLGVVLTKFEANRAHFGYGYDYGYGYGRERGEALAE